MSYRMMANPRLVGLGTDATPREAASRLYDEGTEAYNAGNYILSARKFREAYEILPNAVVLVAIGRAEEAQGNEYAAYELYQRYLSQDPSGPAAEMAREGTARTQPPKQVSTTAPVPSGPKPATPAIPAAVSKPLPTEEVFEEARGPSIAVWAVTGVGILGLMGLGYWLTRPKKVAANRRRRRRRR